MDLITNNFLLIYLISAFFIFISLLFFKRNKIKSITSKRQKILILLYSLYSISFALIVPVAFISPEILVSLQILSGEDDPSNKYKETEEYDKDMITIIIIFLIFIAFISSICFLII